MKRLSPSPPQLTPLAAAVRARKRGDWVFETLESRVLLNAELGVPPPPDPTLVEAASALAPPDAQFMIVANVVADPGGGPLPGTDENDTLESGTGDDALAGGLGDDRYVF